MLRKPDDRLLNRLTAFLCERRERIARDWTAAVHRDDEIQTSETITAKQLRDHLPEMFDDLVDLLRRPEDLVQQEQADRNARSHGFHRWQQGYSLLELLRELARVRNIIIDHL